MKGALMGKQVNAGQASKCSTADKAAQNVTPCSAKWLL
jgi:hypothetical protein